MDKLVITVTCDSTMSYPRNPHNPQGVEALAKEYIRGVNAGAAICHLHGPYTLDEKLREDNTKLSDLDLDGWQRLKDLIEADCKPIIQYGIANGRFPQRVELMKQKPDMMSICFNAHDESFQPDPDYPAVELYGIHDRGELEAYCRYTKEYGVKPEVEAFHYGGIWNAMRLVKMGLLDTPVWTTFLAGRLLDTAHCGIDAVHAQSQAQHELQRQCHGSSHSLASLDSIHFARRPCACGYGR